MKVLERIKTLNVHCLSVVHTNKLGNLEDKLIFSFCENYSGKHIYIQSHTDVINNDFKQYTVKVNKTCIVEFSASVYSYKGGVLVLYKNNIEIATTTTESNTYGCLATRTIIEVTAGDTLKITCSPQSGSYRVLAINEI